MGTRTKSRAHDGLAEDLLHPQQQVGAPDRERSALRGAPQYDLRRAAASPKARTACQIRPRRRGMEQRVRVSSLGACPLVSRALA